MRTPSFDLLLAQLNWQALQEDHGIPLAIMGLVVVFLALTLLRVFIGSLPRILAVLDRFYPEQEESPLNALSPELSVAPPTDELSEEILVVIAAAVAATVFEPHRIVQMRELSSEDLSWSLEGRLQHHASHRIQPRNPN